MLPVSGDGRIFYCGQMSMGARALLPKIMCAGHDSIWGKRDSCHFCRFCINMRSILEFVISLNLYFEAIVQSALALSTLIWS